MESQDLGHSKEAMALLIIYRAMNSKIKEEVRSLINEEKDAEKTKMLTHLSLDAWSEDWIDDPVENELWENFYKSNIY